MTALPNDHSLYFDSVNRNKRSVCIDFYSAEEREILEKLIAESDILVENFKLGILEKLGLTTGRLEQLNPQLVVGYVNSFGITGLFKDDAGLDQVIQGMSGFISVTGSGANTYRAGAPIVDITAGMICAFGIVSALMGRSIGNTVSHVTTSLLETVLNLFSVPGTVCTQSRRYPHATGQQPPDNRTLRHIHNRERTDQHSGWQRQTVADVLQSDRHSRHSCGWTYPRKMEDIKSNCNPSMSYDSVVLCACSNLTGLVYCKVECNRTGL